MIFRTNGTNLFWNYVQSETMTEYSFCLDKLAESRITPLSFTIDGRRGVFQLLKIKYPTTPIQMCHFHQVAIVTRYITKKPKTACGQEIRELVLTLSKTNEEAFKNRFNNLQEKYNKFLKEKNENGQFVHRGSRSAIRSIKINLPYLFTYEHYPQLHIPNTSNSCDGSFGQWKSKVKLHRGMNIQRKKQVIDTFLSHFFP